MLLFVIYRDECDCVRSSSVLARYYLYWRFHTQNCHVRTLVMNCNQLIRFSVHMSTAHSCIYLKNKTFILSRNTSTPHISFELRVLHIMPNICWDILRGDFLHFDFFFVDFSLDVVAFNCVCISHS